MQKTRRNGQRATTVLALALAVVTGASIAATASVTLPEETTLDLSLSPAPAGSVSGGQTVGATPITAVDALNPIQCMGKNDGYFEGDRLNGTVNGTWTFTGFSSCNSPMVGVAVDVDLVKDGVEKSSTADASCTNCQAIYANPKSADCSSCGGVWRLVSQHTFTFPAGFVITDYDTGRCTLLDPLSIRCTVRSNKIRL